MSEFAIGDLVRLTENNAWNARWVEAGLLRYTYRITSLIGETANLEPVVEGTVIGPHGQTEVGIRTRLLIPV